MAEAKGSCFCGEVEYSISGNVGLFQYCHCSRCRKVSGSAHCANLFVSPDQFQWIKGESQVKRFEPKETKHFATCFCGQCGSTLPWLTKSAKTVVIPAGTLDQDPGIRPQRNLFWGSKACWFVETSELEKFEEMPNR